MGIKDKKCNREALHNIIAESIDKVLKEGDRHRPGYWKERWTKQKAAKAAEKQAAGETEEKTKPKKTTKKKDRHRPGYYREYNKKHPERLNRGFTKGYNNGNVDDGRVRPNGVGREIFPGVYILGYDELGRPITNDSLGDMIRNKEMEWHDDDWCEDDD